MVSIVGVVDTMSTLVSVGPDATGKARRRARRAWSDEEKRQMVAQTYEAGTSVSVVARRHDLNANLLFTWRREARQGERIVAAPETPPPAFAPIDVIPDQEVPSCTRPEGQILIELPGGARVRVEGVVSEAALVRALRALRAAS
ncbi:MAG: transposase [Phenylobacterium sp.]|nr:transposase [Phenylobacterium sp.]